VIVVPAGIYTAELVSMLRLQRDARECGNCALSGHEADAKHCRRCGERLYSPAPMDRAS
jgi:voltage-gated potassium channel